MAVNLQIILLFLALTGNPSGIPPQDKPVDKNCCFKGKKLYGKIKFVDSFPDLKIEIVENFPDLNVKLVDNFPDGCGKWQIVENFPDLKVQIVKNFPDLRIKFVDNFPGMP